jgi:hypothetical protein
MTFAPELLTRRRKAVFILLLAVLVLAAYAPAFRNGFISDDYVVLERVQQLQHDPLYLFSMPPEGFRSTMYTCFGFLKAIFGYRPTYFYAFTVALHLLNVVLFGRVLLLLNASPTAAALGSLFFAVYQNPQEAVMWLVAMNEALLAACVLAALLAWLKGRCLLAGFFCVAALLSKESAVVILLALPLANYRCSKRPALRCENLYVLVPVLVCAGLYLYTAHANPYMTLGLYSFSWRALWVGANTLHRMVFPWLYVVLILLIATRRLTGVKPILQPFAWMVLALTPYVFLTYQNHVPSRSQYVASMGFAWLLALLTEKLVRPWFQCALAAVFLAGNIAYLWIAKEAQYLQRAAPTTQLVLQLRMRPPDRILVLNFPANPWIAKCASRSVPGWRPDLILANESLEACPKCSRLVWNSRALQYAVIKGPL